jgi:hypothetical protein
MRSTTEDIGRFVHGPKRVGPDHGQHAFWAGLLGSACRPTDRSTPDDVARLRRDGQPGAGVMVYGYESG